MWNSRQGRRPPRTAARRRCSSVNLGLLALLRSAVARVVSARVDHLAAEELQATQHRRHDVGEQVSLEYREVSDGAERQLRHGYREQLRVDVLDGDLVAAPAVGASE